MSPRKKRRTTNDIVELALLAPIVIAQRSARMMQPRRAKANRREARLMVSEKIGASTHSLFGMAMAAVRMQAQFASLMTRAWFAPGAVDVAALLQSSTDDLSNRAISPYLKKVRANARRLAR